MGEQDAKRCGARTFRGHCLLLRTLYDTDHGVPHPIKILRGKR